MSAEALPQRRPPTTPPLPPVRLERIGIVMMSAVGDAVHVMPVVHALKAHAPHARLSWVLQPGPATLVRGHPLVDEVLPFNRGRGWRAYTDIRRTLATRPFDVVLALQVYLKAGIVTGCTRAPVKLGFDRARARDANWLFTTHRIAPHPGQHVQDQYLEFLDALGVPHGAPQWTLGPWDEAERAAQRAFLSRFNRPVAAIVVATSKPEKDWMPDRWGAVCRLLWEEHGLQPVLVGGTSPRERAAEAAILRLAPMAHSALGSGLRGLAGILDGAAVALSPDTGPLHLAVALRTPVVGLMGYTNPRRVGPYDYARDLLIDAYGDPGEDYPLDLTYRPGRMARITVDQVAAMLARWRARYAPARLAEVAAKASGPKG